MLTSLLHKYHLRKYTRLRKDMRYYALVRRWLLDHSPGNLLVDVGSRGTDIATQGDFARRIALDRVECQPTKSVEAVRADWLTWTPPVRASVVTCLQVLEHLPDEVVGRFARKLLDYADVALVSVPYMWPKGACKYHVQDPVSLDMLLQWMDCPPARYEIIEDNGRQRLIAEFYSEMRGLPNV